MQSVKEKSGFLKKSLASFRAGFIMASPADDPPTKKR
jgi:hypothetical protein